MIYAVDSVQFASLRLGPRAKACHAHKTKKTKNKKEGTSE